VYRIVRGDRLLDRRRDLVDEPVDGDDRVGMAVVVPGVTFVTVGEFFKGAFKRQWGERRVQQLEAWLRNVVVLPYTGEIGRVWGRVSAECEAKGQPIPPNDAWIAACCLSHDVPLMTLNRRHFEQVEGLRLVPPAPVTGA
jgi:predicted nucleic acid-binding protein